MKSQADHWDYRRMFLWALTQNVFLLAFSLLLVDDGRMFRAAVSGSFGYWLIALAIWTHHHSVERYEIVFVRWGMVVLWITFGIAFI